MALQDTNLLHLLLAYSAIHRCRYLNYDEPLYRIDRLLGKTFPSLRRAMTNHELWASDVNLTILILLISIGIDSPRSLGSATGLHSHLKIAAQMIIARAENTSKHLRGEAYYFLLRWLARIEILETLHRETSSAPLAFRYLSGESGDNDKIDCFLGLTSRSLHLLGEVAVVASKHNTLRQEYEANSDSYLLEDHNDAVVCLYETLRTTRLHKRSWCGEAEKSGCAVLELCSIDEAFCGAATLYLSGLVGHRVLTPSFQESAENIIMAILRIQPNSSAATTLLYPLCIAGSFTNDERFKAVVRQYLKAIRGLGIGQVCFLSISVEARVTALLLRLTQVLFRIGVLLWHDEARSSQSCLLPQDRACRRRAIDDVAQRLPL